MTKHHQYKVTHVRVLHVHSQYIKFIEIAPRLLVTNTRLVLQLLYVNIKETNMFATTNMVDS